MAPSLTIKKSTSPKGFVRQTIHSDMLEGIVTIPRSLKHRMVEVILLPLDIDISKPEGFKAGSLTLGRYAGTWAGEPLVREEQGSYEVRRELA